MPVLTAKELAVVGYNGFRQGTQIDPIWNAYLLALVVEAAPAIESKRVDRQHVFSYRYSPDAASGALFDRSVGWVQFQEQVRKKIVDYQFVLKCDISDFYPRIYHHRLENSLIGVVGKPEISNRIMKLLGAISEGPSYGLPVGGPAARLLSELLLNRTDRLLLSERIEFCRFVDDYVIFAKTREEAHSSLLKLTQILLKNEGLTLQKNKTRVMSAPEYLNTVDMTGPIDGEDTNDERARTFRRLRIHFDPYSPTAEADYKALAEELSRFDIVGMLGRELAKSRIDEGLTRRLVGAIKHLGRESKSEAVLSLIGSMDLLYPVFPSVMLLCRSLVDELDSAIADQLFSKLRSLITTNSYITQVPANLAFALRVLALDKSEETEVLLADVYSRT
jgi:hypothetical protein